MNLKQVQWIKIPWNWLRNFFPKWDIMFRKGGSCHSVSSSSGHHAEEMTYITEEWSTKKGKEEEKRGYSEKIWL